jgi:hypothetical protein
VWKEGAVTLEVHMAFTVERKSAGEDREVTGGRLAELRVIVEGLLTTFANSRFVMWIA